ncbi:MAG: FAD-binding protein [Raoultibacter sp.]
MKNGISRRSFIGGSALSAVGLLGGVALAGCAPSSTPPATKGNDAEKGAAGKPSWMTKPDAIADSSIKETIETEMLVIGAGFAGLSAAFSAAENGVKVIVAEKEPEFSQRGAGAGTVNCDFAQTFEDGAVKSVEDAQFRWMQTCGNRPNEALIAEFINRSGEAGNWLVNIAKAHNCHIGLWDGYSRNPLLPDEPGYLIINGGDDITRTEVPFVAVELMYLEGKKAGVEYLFNTGAEQLITNEAGAVVGAIVKVGKEYKKILASKGIVLATGDIGGSKELCEYYCPVANTIPNIYMPAGANSGDGHKMALWAGAEMQEAPFPPMLHPQRYSDPFSNQLQGPFLYVDEKGKRFFNEGTWVQARSLQIMQNTADDCAYSIFDASWPEDLLASLPSGGGMFWDMFREKKDSTYQTTVDYYAESIDKYIDSVYFKADTLDELAKKINMPADTLKKTVAHYNELCAKGYDEDFHKSKAFLYPIDKPPYYASKVGAVVLTVVGGVKINPALECLGAEGSAVKGLYAIGNVSGDIYAVDYPINVPGNSHGRALTQGYLVGRMIAGVE